MIPKLLIQLAVTAASMAMTAMKKIEGPRLDDLKFTSGDYGSSLAMVWGKRRLQCPIFWAEDLKEVKQQRKTKGGKYNDYTYFGTWAVALAGHEVSGITRIWLDTHLAYDMTGAGPVTPFDFGSTSDGGKGGGSAGAGGFSINDHMAVYLGTETQEQDPRMLATVEDKQGEGSCPAYRGTAYIVFKDLPLEKLGNRIPQVSVEVVSSSAAAYPYETFPTVAPGLSRMWGAAFSPDFSRFMWGQGTGYDYEVWDVAARAQMITGSFPVDLYIQDGFALKNNGNILAIGDDFHTLYEISGDGVGLVATTVLSAFVDEQQAGVVAVMDGSGTEHWGTIPLAYLTTFFFDGARIVADDLAGFDWRPCAYFTDSYGDVWAAGAQIGIGATQAVFYRLVTTGDRGGPDLVVVSGLPATAAVTISIAALQYTDETHAQFVFTWTGNNVYAADIETGAVLASTTSVTLDAYNYDTQFRSSAPGASSLWLQNKEMSLADLTVLRTVTLNNWTTLTAAGIVYDPINHALITGEDTGTPSITWRYLDRISGNGVALGTIASDVADMVGVQDYDFSALDQTVIGWSATQGQGSNMLEPLFDAYASDIAPHDFTIRGVKRTGVSTGTLATASFAKDQGARYTLNVHQASELPKALVYSFADTSADQQPNNIRVSRPLDATDATDERTIDLTTFASDPDTMRGLADRHFRYLWNSRKEASFALTFQQLAIEPGDVKAPTFDDETFTARCVKTVIRANGIMATDWVYDNPSLASLDGASGAQFDGRNPSVIVVPGLSKGFVLDIPLIRDVDSSATPLVYIAAAPYSEDVAFPGASAFQAVDGEYSDEIGAIASAERATWGYTTDILQDANPWLWDRGGSVSVSLQVGSLTGTTEAAIDANPFANLILIGDEVLNFTAATLEGDGTYTLSGLKRGRRGTEWACATHAARDVVLLLNNPEAADLGLSEVGTDLSFKVITSGRTEAGSFPIPMEPFTGASLKPYAPCHLEAVKESNGDWTLSWVRRTRVGGAWTSGTSIPLSENSEEYELDLSDGVDSVTKTVTSATTYTWLQADQITDVGAEVMAGDLDWAVVQISDAVDRGFLAEATA